MSTVNHYYSFFYTLNGVRKERHKNLVAKREGTALYLMHSGIFINTEPDILI